jgi:hypothetical protein
MHGYASFKIAPTCIDYPPEDDQYLKKYVGTDFDTLLLYFSSHVGFIVMNFSQIFCVDLEVYVYRTILSIVMY